MDIKEFDIDKIKEIKIEDTEFAKIDGRGDIEGDEKLVESEEKE